MSLLTVELLFTVVSIGVGGVFPITTISVQNAVPRHDLGTATALITFMRNLGAATGVAVFGTLVIGAGVGEPASAAYGPDYVASFRWIFLAGAIGFLLSAAVLGAMEERPLRARGSGQI
jgi:MFS family permease